MNDVFSGATYRFWIVVSSESGMTFRPFRHATEESAFNEAARLASGAPSVSFYVLEAKGACKKQDVITKKFDQESIPF